MITAPSAILVICASLMEDGSFFLLKKAHFYPRLLQGPSRCASRGQGGNPFGVEALDQLGDAIVDPIACCLGGLSEGLALGYC